MSAEPTESPAVTAGSDATAPCGLCAHAAAHRWWGDSGVTHCKTCHATWRVGTKFIHCVRCHRTFTTPGVLDGHQRDGRCHDPETIVDGNGNRIFGDPQTNTWGTIVHRGLPRDI